MLEGLAVYETSTQSLERSYTKVTQKETVDGLPKHAEAYRLRNRFVKR